VWFHETSPEIWRLATASGVDGVQSSRRLLNLYSSNGAQQQQKTARPPHPAEPTNSTYRYRGGAFVLVGDLLACVYWHLL
jgi:hypothetical protein